MDIADLRSFLVIARHANLRAAADELHQTPSALSKAVKRLEASLATPVFDRIGKAIRLNAAGERLRERALALVTLAEQMQAEFRGVSLRSHCRLLAPAVLQWGFGASLAARLSALQPRSSLAFVTLFEDAALAALARGEGDLALVTDVALGAALPAGLEAKRLGEIRMQLAAGPSHPLAGRGEVATTEVLQHDFACPQRSMFCGLERGSRADGWRDDRLPRRIRFWLDDLQLLISLVASGQALAYLPDFALAQHGDLMRLAVPDCPYECVEQVHLVWRTATASGWLAGLMASL
ncbi:DNA-binding transcriptional LysR family regulator [Pelomonas saccharophila]|uniref:DNA-binding transcriptional LysR family regulator n=1 Tax=Roseateles saccharophilus TaxID=304 RepID=A0ABU1YPE2_ROSSA|nr:LysR family transcriptional regulator [Roseateles saccharophilus]MDR7270736.1 DNA-binding transcriptional LysR family regulator [Roseateles saccharophilus]